MKRVFALFIILVIVKIFISLGFPSPWVFGDSAIYTAKTRAILTEGNFNFDQYHYGGPAVPPLYSVFLIPAYLFDDPAVNHRAILIINAVLSSLLVFPIFWLARRFLKIGAAFWLTLIAGLWPAGFGFTFMVMSENLFFPLFILSAILIYHTFNSPKYRWDLLLGFCLAALYLTRITGVFPLGAWLLLRSFYFLFAKKSSRFHLRTLLTFIAIGLPLLGWFTLKESGTDGTASGYDLSSYVSALKDVFHSLPNFKKAFLLALYQSSFYIIATFFLFIPLLFAGIFFFPKEERRALAPLSPVIAYTVLCSLLFLGGSVLHQYIFAPKVADRYLLFGRYIEPTVPLFILLGGIIYFYYKRSFALNVKLKSFVLFGGATAAAVVFLPVSYYDIVNNISLLYVRGQNVLQEFPVVWIWLLFSFFFFFFFPARWVKHAVLLLIVLFSSWTLLQAYPLANEPSQKYAQQIEIPLWISSNVEGGAVIGFDADQSWEKNLMQFYWLYEFWLGKNYHLAHVRVEDFEGSYFISTKEIAQPLVAAEKENSLKLYRVR